MQQEAVESESALLHNRFSSMLYLLLSLTSFFSTLNPGSPQVSSSFLLTPSSHRLPTFYFPQLHPFQRFPSLRLLYDLRVFPSFWKFSSRFKVSTLLADSPHAGRPGRMRRARFCRARSPGSQEPPRAVQAGGTWPLPVSHCGCR